ncbi:MAG TPA: plastocyanin/azurin family copper-binding protein [Gemmatimonadaceae bacterium]|nr:plastocyanin/azurin family copper-binding protein [Gemmatimonadaceae bacterium]
MKSGMNGALRIAALFSMLAAAACKTEQPKTSEGKEGAEKTEEAATGGVKPTGDTVNVELYSDASGNYFKPNELEAKRGDVVRFTMKVGVHNVHFLPDSNTIKTGLPPASDLLQLPDQTYDLLVTLQEGKYYFQCDPHAALGMKGHLKVEDK